jgi:hypothetical protein
MRRTNARSIPNDAPFAVEGLPDLQRAQAALGLIGGD